MRHARSLAWSLLLVVACAGAEPEEPASSGASIAAEGSESGAPGVVAEPVEEARPEVPDDESAALAPVAEAPLTFPEVDRVMGLDGAVSTSLHGPNAGELRGGVPLPLRGPGFRFNPRRSERARFGTVELVQALIRAARDTHAAVGGELTVNDIGFEQGGPIPHHGSHQNGRDVDVLFYLTSPDGTPMDSVGAIIAPDGTGVDFRDPSRADDDVQVRIDLPRTWRFIEAIVLDERAMLQRAFVAEHIRTMLLDHARANGGDPSAIARFADVTCQPSYPHDDHFHFRFYCTPEDLRLGCRDTRPTYPWRRAQLREVGLRPMIAGPERNRAPTTTAAEARAAAGPLHSEVERWLRMREAWMQPPRTGRRFCR